MTIKLKNDKIERNLSNKVAGSVFSQFYEKIMDNGVLNEYKKQNTKGIL